MTGKEEIREDIFKWKIISSRHSAELESLFEDLDHLTKKLPKDCVLAPKTARRFGKLNALVGQARYLANRHRVAELEAYQAYRKLEGEQEQ